MTAYRWNGEQFVDKQTGAPMELPERGEIAMPAVFGDLPDYESPITGKVVSGRAARREEFKKHNVIEKDPLPKEKKYAHSKKWADRLGYEWTGKAP